MAISAAGPTIAGTATTTNASVAITFDPYSGYKAQCGNTGPDVYMIRGGVGAQTAVTTDLTIFPGTFRDVAFPAGTTHVGVICPTSTAGYVITPITGE